MFPAKFHFAISTDKPLKIFQADIFGILPDLLLAFVSLCHADMLPYMVALYNQNGLLFPYYRYTTLIR
jgi:hypothetical protein